MEEMNTAANSRIRIGLVLGEIAEKEALALTDADIEAAIAEDAARRSTSTAAMRAMLEKNEGMEALRNRAQTKKVLDFLRAATIMEEKVVKPGEEMSDEDNAIDESEDEAGKEKG